MPTFNEPKEVDLKIMLEREKMLFKYPAQSPFPTVFYPVIGKFKLCKTNLVVCKCYQFGPVYPCVVR